MGLFSKKSCSICGGDIGLLGNRKLEDGNLCKKCAAKLSPWFSERRSSTVEEIRAQLSYREANQARVAAFRTSRTLGTGKKIYIDEAARAFMVTSASDLQEANPDVLDISSITDVRYKVHEMKNELKTKDNNGNTISYNPPRFRYSYDFYIDIDVNNPYFNNLHFNPFGSSIVIEPNYQMDVRRTAALLLGNNQGLNSPVNDPKYRQAESTCEEIRSTLLNLRSGGYAEPARAAEAAPAATAAPAAPAATVTCPWCGSTVPAGATCPNCCGPL